MLTKTEGGWSLYAWAAGGRVSLIAWGPGGQNVSGGREGPPLAWRVTLSDETSGPWTTSLSDDLGWALAVLEVPRADAEEMASAMSEEGLGTVLEVMES